LNLTPQSPLLSERGSKKNHVTPLLLSEKGLGDEIKKLEKRELFFRTVNDAITLFSVF
jgi:hypothetical protein